MALALQPSLVGPQPRASLQAGVAAPFGGRTLSLEGNGGAPFPR